MSMVQLIPGASAQVRGVVEVRRSLSAKGHGGSGG